MRFGILKFRLKPNVFCPFESIANEREVPRHMFMPFKDSATIFVHLFEEAKIRQATKRAKGQGLIATAKHCILFKIGELNYVFRHCLFR